ncbi:hypothetical protein B484DRAFT_459876 [Ochromonadaceae sp. CCMP2298]|nr:hypothetical protein B484DRAFT_459876 [Ochromonadaceae sp. CCMP2298]
MLRPKMMEILQSQLPGRVLEEIHLHEEWYRRMKVIANKYRDAEAVYTTSRADLLAEARRGLLEHRDDRMGAMERDRQWGLREAHRGEMHRRLGELRAQREVLDEQQTRERAAQEVEAAKRLRGAAEAEQRERGEQKVQLEVFRKIREGEQREERVRLEGEAEAARVRLQTMVEQSRPKVQRRAQLLDEKGERRRAREAEVAQEELRRIELLNQLASQVPYYQALLDATARLDHVTASAKGHAYTAPDPAWASRGHLALNGFTDGKVISDSRFRLAEALRACGVSNSSAAQAAVARNFARPHLAIHGLF